MPKPLPHNLRFINDFRLSGESIENAPWRESAFDADIWQCSFGSSKTVIDFRKVLDDGSLLTAPKNQAFLTDIKRFLCLQTNPLITGSVTLNSKTARLRIATALHALDYFLLRGPQLRVASQGFRAVTANDVTMFVDILTSNRSIKASIYEPTRRIFSFLSEIRVSPEELAQTRARWPDLFHSIDLGISAALSSEGLQQARAWLKLHGFYSANNYTDSSRFRYRLRRRALLRFLIGNQVLSDLKFDGLILDGLDVAPIDPFGQELPAVPVNNLDGDERASNEYVGVYIDVLKTMVVAHENRVELIPRDALQALDDAALLRRDRTKERARFTTLPFGVANRIFSNAIEFYLEHGNALVDYYLSLAATHQDIRALPVPVPPTLKRLGVTDWRSSAGSSEEFFTELRSGRNLFNMLEVLFGAVAILVNTLMARRASELEELTSESIVEDQGWYFLAFNLRKANVLTHRQRTLRPMPHIAAEALGVLARLSSNLRDLGYTSDGSLFALPFDAWHSNPPFYGTCGADLRRCFNRFCDYFEISTDDQGRRHYVRAHQLRRNFAMLFFWHGTFGGIEILRHFLGHKRAAMTYHYVAEAIPGRILRRIKASMAKELIQTDQPATAELAQLICTRYNLTLDDLHILPERDVVDYIEDLLNTGQAEVEPEFIQGPSGEEYRIIYKVHHNNKEALRI